MAGNDVYQTKNGTQTVDSMRQQLFNAGWDGKGTIENAYARTTGAPVNFVSSDTGVSATGQKGATTSSGGGGPAAVTPTKDQGANLNAAQLLLNQAQQAAYQAYLSARLNLDTDQLAFTKATQAFQNKIAEASLTGTYNGQQTQAAQEQQFTQGLRAGELTGSYNGAPTLAAQSEQNKTALGYLQQIGQLRGPNDPFQYLRTLSGTPQGITDLVNASWGRYRLGGAPSGEQAAPATVGGQIANLNMATGNGGAVPGTAYNALVGAIPQLPGAGQIAPQQFNQMDPSQKAALFAAYEAGLGPSGAMRPEDAQAAYLRSLPKYTLSGAGTIVR